MTNQKLIELAQRLGRDTLPEKRVPKPTPAVLAPTPAQITDPNLNLEDYILMDGQKHGSYSYSDLIVAKKKTLHGKNWRDAHAELHKQNFQMLSIRQYIDFINLLNSGAVYNGKGTKLPKTEIDQLLDEISTPRAPWRAEWLDADFKVVNGELRINYNHKTINGKLTPQITEPLEDCLMKDKTPGIDLGQWLSTANYQGLPPKNISKGNLWYWHPLSDNNSVARFGAVSGRADLDCYRGPSDSDSALGVRAARTK